MIPRLDKDCVPFAAAFAVAALLLGLWVPWFAGLPLAALVSVLWFFRDPERTPPEAPDALISPADGRVIVSGPEKISVFLSLLDVHVCRAPASGRVESVVRTPGRFLAAFRDEASESNERATITLAAERGRIEFTLVAGIVARRIVCRVSPGQEVSAGERIGLVRFGSRVDVALPSGAESQVRVGDRVRAGESILARLERRPSRSTDS